MSSENSKKRDLIEQPEDAPEAKRQKLAETPVDVNAVILDIEGTTTPISFIADVLFPYVRNALAKHLDSNWDKEELMADIAALRALAEEDTKNGTKVPEIPATTATKEEIVAGVMANVFHQMDQDRKTTALKALQGHIWQNGYAEGQIKGEVWEDVLNAFKQWKASSTPVYIYSSGSVHAQKLIFGFSDKGDLLPYLAGHFDTTIGPKVESTSYTKIIDELGKNHPGLTAEGILFVTDNILEADAAKTAGVHTVLAVRPGNKALPESHPHPTAETFDKLFQDFRFPQRVEEVAN